MRNELNKELEKRCLHFERSADDVMTAVRSEACANQGYALCHGLGGERAQPERKSGKDTGDTAYEEKISWIWLLQERSGQRMEMLPVPCLCGKAQAYAEGMDEPQQKHSLLGTEESGGIRVLADGSAVLRDAR